MDARLQSISDPDKRMVKTFKQAEKEVYESRINKLQPNEIGYLHVSNFMQDGFSAEAKEVETMWLMSSIFNP